DDLNVSGKTGNQFLIPLEEYLNACMAAARIGRNKKRVALPHHGQGRPARRTGDVQIRCAAHD
ncbi:MAG: hypothetical protein WB586_01355, partial [Chthoniobacterales bacterium]